MRGLIAIFSRNIRNFLRDRTKVAFSLIMSLLLLFVFSFVMGGVARGIERPLPYLIAGIAIMTVFQQAMNNSTEILTDLASGFMKEVIVSPVPRWQVSLGQILSAAAIACAQGIVILVAGFFFGLRLSPLAAIGSLGVMALAGVAFASFGLFVATVSRNSSTFQIATSVVLMPLSFLSGAYIPATALPVFLRPVVVMNPLTHVTAAFRAASLGLFGRPTSELVSMGIAFPFGSVTVTPIGSLLLILAFGAAFFALSVLKFSSADFSSVKVGFRRRGH